jgi:hypothetical protein
MGEGGGEITTRPTSLEIYTAEDTPHDNRVLIKWQCDMPVEIYAQTPIYNGYGTPESYYEYNGTWTVVHTSSGAESEWKDYGSDRQRYYRVATSGTQNFKLTPSGSYEAVGKFVIDIPNSEAEPTKVFISCPFEPLNSEISVEIGAQADQGDTINIADAFFDPLFQASYRNGRWRDDLNPPNEPNFTIEAGVGYTYTSNSTNKTINLVGRIFDLQNTTIIPCGDPNTTVTQIGRAFPSIVGIDNAGLNGSTVGGVPSEAGTITLSDYNGQTMNMAIHRWADHWRLETDVPTFEITPGVGYLFQEPYNPVTWTQKP